MIVFYVFFAVSGRYVFFLAYFHKKIPISFLGPFGGSYVSRVVTKNVDFQLFCLFPVYGTPGIAKFCFFLARSDTINIQKVKRGVKTTSDRFSG